MIKHISLALAAIIAVPAYCGPVAATEYWDWNMATGNPTTPSEGARQVRQALSQEQQPARRRSWPT